MVKHIIMWNLKDELSAQQKQEAKQKIKNDLEALSNLNGVVSIKVFTEPLPSSNCDILLISEFEDEAALDHYQTHPGHEAVKDYLITVRKDRVCFDGVK